MSVTKQYFAVYPHNMAGWQNYYLEGQTAEFDIKVRSSRYVPGSFTWYHNDFVIRGGPFTDGGQRVQVEESHNGTWHQSRLRIKALVWRNSGKYS